MSELLDRARNSEVDPAAELSRHQGILACEPHWEKTGLTDALVAEVRKVDASEDVSRRKAAMLENPQVLDAYLSVLSLNDSHAIMWVLAQFYDMIREDCSVLEVFHEGLRRKAKIFNTLLKLMVPPVTDRYTVDKAAWLLSSIVGHYPNFFHEDHAQEVAGSLLEGNACSLGGALDAVCNLLKADDFRATVWAVDGVETIVLGVPPGGASSENLYKCVFCLWMLSFGEDTIEEFRTHNIVARLRAVLSTCKAEKVVRLALTVVRTLMDSADMREECVEENLVGVVETLEYEKWRDAEFYEEIQETARRLHADVAALSSYARYERELSTGTLHWGFIHTSKFWAQNYKHFETKDYQALKMLAGLLNSRGTDVTTLAICCHDLGAFVAVHPMGKKKIAQLNVKERVMELMASQDPVYRDVRREALLCCQKIMLERWQDAERGA